MQRLNIPNQIIRLGGYNSDASTLKGNLQQQGELYFMYSIPLSIHQRAQVLCKNN
jgi:hypothetical protein